MFLKAEGEWVTTAAAQLPSCCFADSALCVRRWSSLLFLYLFLFGYSCTSWIDLDSVQFCCVPSRMHSGTWTTPPFRRWFLHTRSRMQNLLTTRNFPCSKLFHDSYFSLDVVRLFFSFLFCSRATHSETAKGPRFAPSSGPLPAVRLAQAIPTVYS